MTTAAVVALLFGLLLPWLFSHALPVWPWAIAAILAAQALLFPSSLAPLYRGWMRAGMVMGYINTRIILFLLYYLVFFPVGLVIRLIGRDTMSRTLSPGSGDSYRVASTKRDYRHFERPY